MMVSTRGKAPMALKMVSLAMMAALSVGCSTTEVQSETRETEQARQVPSAVKDDTRLASQQANALFEDIFMRGVMRSPSWQSFLGIKDAQDKWDDISEEHRLKEHRFDIEDLAKLEAVDAKRLDAQTRLSLQLYKEQLQHQIDDYRWRLYGYPVNQMYGTHTMIPSLLINQHRVENIKDAQDYISRLNGVKTLMQQLVADLKVRAEQGIIAPKFIWPYVVSDSRNIIKGAPFDDGPDSTLLADFRAKVNKLAVDDDKKAALVVQAKRALLGPLRDGYRLLIDYAGELEKQASDDAGAWKFPQGSEFYANALKRTTTTDLTAAQIHQIGLDEVARIHGEMRQIMKKVGFNGDLAAFFRFMKTDPQFYYPQTDAGRAHYLTEATAIINRMKSRLDELFLTKPKADLTVKAVEAFREKSAGKAFYERPSMDGSRPGIYYVNLYRMSDMPTYQMQALAYHEGIPGHHMQIAISSELSGIPKFRKLGGYTAYVEGWGLYAEKLPTEINAYKDPYSDFGRLAMELWRACRLVVDTGIHDKRWTREQAIDYLLVNTPNPKGDVVKAIDRYIVMPSQATAYKIGMLKILELREKAKEKMKGRFDIRRFHDVVLRNGPLPLNVLEQFVDEYIDKG